MGRMRGSVSQDPTLEPRLTAAQVEALAVLYEGPADRTSRRSSGHRVNHMAAMVLCIYGLARHVAARTFAITAAGMEAHERLRDHGTVARCESGSPSSPSSAS